MANLISRKAAIEHMKSMAGCATCNNYNEVRCRACSWDDAMSIVDEEPDVDAIPVEWLREYTAVGATPRGDRLTEGNERIIIHRILNEWQKEQEAR